MWVQTPWRGYLRSKISFFMYNTIFVYILRVPVSMKGSKGHQKSRKQRKQTGFKELAHICVLCSAIASPSLLSSSPIRVNPKNQTDAANFRRLSVGRAPHDDEDGISDEEKSDSDPEEAHTAVRSVVSIPKQAAEEALENPKVAELKERLINAYSRLFSGVANKNPPDRGRFGTARIKLKLNPKIYRHREYQLQSDRAEAMKKLLAEFIERGWIEPSDSECTSPAFIVPKKQKGEWSLVVDYRGLNEQTEHDSYSLPLIDSILQKQQKKRIFTVLDLKHGYHQMPLHPDSSPCKAMSTPLGPMQWKVVPMGAKNGNAAFQRMMEDLLRPVRDCAHPFVDDIIIGSGTEDMTEDELIEAHEKDLRRVLSELDKHNMVCKPTKASLFVKEVEFAGHVVGHGQRRPMPRKLASLHHWERPQTISELRSFMGFCNYYLGYVRMYAQLSGPLHKMLAQDAAGGQVPWPEGVQEEACLDP